MTGGTRVRIPVTEHGKDILKRHTHAMTRTLGPLTPSRQARTQLIEALLRYSLRYRRPEDLQFTPNGEYLDVRLHAQELLTRTPRALGAHLNLELQEFDQRFRAVPESPGMRPLDLLLPQETMWALRVRAVSEGRALGDVLTEVTQRSLLEIENRYHRAGGRREEVEVRVSPEVMNTVTKLLHNTGGHPYFALQHHVVLKVGALEAVA